MRRPLIWGVLALSLACAQSQIVPTDLDRIHRPAFLGRVEDTGGPHARVFREDPSYVAKGRLVHLDANEADRRLQLKLLRAVSRFQAADGLRAALQARLPPEEPWTSAIPAAKVASVFETLLVREEPASAPDYNLLKPTGADSVLEIVIQDYGMRGEKERTQAYLKGYARLFMLNGGELWRRSFQRDNVSSKAPSLDPFEVGKTPELYRNAESALIGEVAEELAQSLRAANRTPQAAPSPPSNDIPMEAPAPVRPPRPRLPEDEL